MENQFQYDSVKYPTAVFAEIRPDALGAMAALHGVTPERISDCRVLELGCGDGASLLSIAYAMPQSECVGIDLSEPRIAEANAYAKQIGVSNARFEHADVMEFDAERFGKFDFIVAHGLYSWVPDLVRERVLWIYKNCLVPNGVGFISYNTLPGWYLKKIIRDGGRFINGDSQGSFEAADRAVEFIRMAQSAALTGTIYSTVLAEELKGAENSAREALFHDELADVNNAFYFADFASQLTDAGLAFLTESDPIMHFTGRMGQKANEYLRELPEDPIRREQCLDFFRGTRFRSTLICLPEQNPQYDANTSALDALYFSSAAKPAKEQSDLCDGSSVEFVTENDSHFSTNFGFTKMFLGYLGNAYPRPVPFDEVVAMLRESSEDADGFDEMLNVFRQHMIGLIHANVVDVRCFAAKVAEYVSDRPKASAFARWQAAHGMRYVTTLTGRNIQMEDETARRLLTALDGTRTLSEAVAFAGVASDAKGIVNANEHADHLLRLGLLIS